MRIRIPSRFSPGHAWIVTETSMHFRSRPKTMERILAFNRCAPPIRVARTVELGRRLPGVELRGVGHVLRAYGLEFLCLRREGIDGLSPRAPRPA